AHGRPDVFADLSGGPFRSLERDIAGKAFGNDNIHLAAADIIALDEADVVEIGPLRLAKYPAGFAHLLDSLDFLDPDVEQPDARPGDTEQNARRGGAHDREIGEVLRIGTDRGADVEHDGLAAHRRPDRRNGRPLD